VKRPILITPGDPNGIGPEVACRALVERIRGGEPVNAVMVGCERAIGEAAKAAGLPLRSAEDSADNSNSVAVIAPPTVDGLVEADALRFAVQCIQRGEASALVTGPIHKARMAARGFEFAGHTDFLAHLCGVDGPVMAFVGGRLKVALVTVHVPLRRVTEVLSTANVLRTLRCAHDALVTQCGIVAPRLLVCGVNPHAGDGGLLGDEEVTTIAPAVAAARSLGIDARGPISAEAAFRKAWDGEADLVVAMYHDQGLAPLKLVDFGRSVNWTLGLPIVRTSVDHGTADDLVGTGRASTASMDAAIRWAEHLVQRSERSASSSAVRNDESSD
jgi:4-hydroxythreonine-4-phosphate dehydrogenase